MDYTIPKGLFDILPYEGKEEEAWRASNRWQYVESIFRSTAHDYGFKEIRTPLFEKTDLFIRSVGESSDIVSKEMYTFLDKGNRSMTLRPEGTASTLRAYVEKKLHQIPGLSKFYYIGPMFRYERPQAGRYRQHHQFGAEAIGIKTPEQDVEMIDFLCEIYRRLGLTQLVVHLNSVGDEESRKLYKTALQTFLQPHFSSLSADSQVRFSKNILRILDSKDPQDKKILEAAPSILDFLSSSAKDHFEKVKSLLSSLKISYRIDPALVRGLDYYNKTVFEVISYGLGAQNTIGAGGRYDGLVASLGGPDLASVGFATGIERILQTMQNENIAFPHAPSLDAFFIPLGEQALTVCFQLTAQLRHEKIKVDMDLSGKKIQHSLSTASALNASYCFIVGDNELNEGVFQVKNMKNRTSFTLQLTEILPFLQQHLSERL